MTEIQKRLFALQDEEYRAFNIKLNPTIEPQTMIGIRIPQIKKLAKELKGTDEAEAFLNDLPHEYFEENLLQCYLMYYIKDFDSAIAQVERFLPYANSWSVTDSMKIKAFEKEPEKLIPYIKKWLASNETYTVRCGIFYLMTLFLNDHYDPSYAELVAGVQSEEYYVRMMQAWYFATALAKQYDTAVTFIEQKRLEPWTHNKTIQKAVESYRVTDEHKAYLKTLKIK